MKPNYFNQVTSSFVLWADHMLLDKGGAYTNINNGKLYPVTNVNYYGFYAFNSPYSQWVSDSSISGANIPISISIDGTDTPRGVKNLKINFENGMVLTDKTVSTSSDIRATYAIKVFNMYYSSEDMDTLLITKKFSPKPKTPQKEGAFPEGATAYPCIFVTPIYGVNNPFALGGMDRSTYEFRMAVLSDDTYKLDTAMGLYQDCSQRYIPCLTADKLPFNEYGDIKSGNYYDYKQLCKDSTDFLYIKRVRVSRFPQTLNEQISPKVLGALIDFEVEQLRFPRQ